MPKYGHLDVITRDEAPIGWDSPVAVTKGQLYVDSSTGDLWKARSSGRQVNWDRVSGSGSGSLVINEDPSHTGFAELSLV